MCSSTVSDVGLSRPLGEEVFVTREDGGSRKEGTLVYYPRGFAVLQSDEKLVKIRAGAIVGLRRGSGIARYDPHFVEYQYVGN